MSVCFERKFLIPDASVEKVVEASNRVLKEMGLKILEEESDAKGDIVVLAGEGRLAPLIVRALLQPFGLDDYVDAAQRSGVHVVVSPSKTGVHLNLCGIALSETTGKYKDYTREDVVEEVTDTLEAWDFEEQFINRLSATFPRIKKMK